MLKFKMQSTDEYERLVKFFVENELEFDGDEEVDIRTNIEGMEQTKEYYAFISYKREDKKEAIYYAQKDVASKALTRTVIQLNYEL